MVTLRRFDVAYATNTLARWERGEVSVPEMAAKLALLVVKDSQPLKAPASPAAFGDPLYRNILMALKGHLDKDMFEAYNEAGCPLN